ncbi:MAG: hypothetical protein WCR04_06865 [Fibrobacteraceae bacterium]
MKRLAVLSIFFVFCCSCTHLVLDSSVRFQVRNDSDFTLAKLSVQGDSSYKVWIPDTLLPGKTSKVYEEDWVGSFNIVFYAFDSASNKWTKIDLGTISFDGGSSFGEISQKDGIWHLKIR